MSYLSIRQAIKVILASTIKPGRYCRFQQCLSVKLGSKLKGPLQMHLSGLQIDLNFVFEGLPLTLLFCCRDLVDVYPNCKLSGVSIRFHLCCDVVRPDVYVVRIQNECVCILEVQLVQLKPIPLRHSRISF